MDGFEENDRVIMVAATNLVENLDPALVRPGRFDRKIEVKLPNALERAKIMKIHLKEKPHTLSDMDINKSATFLDGCSGAELENLINLVALQAVRASQISKKEPCISK